MVLFPVISYVDLIVVLVVAWILASFPIYVAGKIISGKDTSFGSAMIAALIGPVVTLFFFIVITAVLSPFLLGFAGVIGAIFAIFALSYLYGALFRTHLLGGFAIAVLSLIITFIVFAIISFIAVLLSGTPVVGPVPHIPSFSH
ncbi:MAG: hypothetical protein RE469_08720 [Cuniculiplasma divulgatum]|jgi:hypothetical protein|nr:MAG: hypothetical protein RE469_08720 [Cuniculiplasma divulgatum]